MKFDAIWETRFGALAMIGCWLLSAGCGDSSDDGHTGSGNTGTSDVGTTTFSCGKAGEFCTEYSGSASSIAAIRDATKCSDRGAVEGTGCAKDGASICTLAQNGSTGTGGAQYYYGLDEDDRTALKSTCEQSGGTFSTR